VKTKITLFAFLSLIIAVAVLYFWNKDPCSGLDPCEQYQCRSPSFYCARTLYESNTIPSDIKDAQQIVMDYINNELGLTAEILSSYQGSGTSSWYQITCRLSDGSEYGYEVAPDGNIYEIKHFN